jgi:hypothetical protein
MARAEHGEQQDPDRDLWRDMIWSAGLLGTVVVLVVLISVVGRL